MGRDFFVLIMNCFVDLIYYEINDNLLLKFREGYFNLKIGVG